MKDKLIFSKVARNVLDEMRILNPEKKTSHNKVDWVIENYTDQVMERMTQWVDCTTDYNFTDEQLELLKRLWDEIT